MKCSNCNSDRACVKYGKTSALRQRWRCQECGKTQTEQLEAIQISDRVLEEIRSLPQIKTSVDEDGWTADYLIEQIVRNYLGIESDYDIHDIAMVLTKRIVV